MRKVDRRRCPDPLSRRNERRRQSAASIQDRAVRRRGEKRKHPSCCRSTRVGCLYTPQWHTDRSVPPTVFLLVWGDWSITSFVEYAWARHGRSGSPIPSADIFRRLRVTQGACRL